MSGEIVDLVVRASGIQQLNPVQELALSAGLLDGKSLVVAAPTASGKTIVAELAALQTIRQGKKVVYIVPLRALASEKCEDFREKYEKLGIRIAISVGDLDATDPWLGRYDLIIVTSEKLDSLLRHGAEWIRSIGLVIVDEVHLLHDPGRGPTLEVLLTRLRRLEQRPRILALSATISNHQELAEWLGAESIQTDWRPVQLYRGLWWDGTVELVPERTYQVEGGDPWEILALQTVKNKKQALVFLSTRKFCESGAEQLGKRVSLLLAPEERKTLAQAAEDVRSTLEHKTPQCERLAQFVEQGVAFHHAGLANKQRAIVEREFKVGRIKVIAATPTLAAGINLPAYRVIIRDLKRFAGFKGMDYLPALEIQQMMGRAGRPKYDKEGEAILIAKSRAEAEYAWDQYINGQPENVKSKLGVEPVLRAHVLALIAGGVAGSREDLFAFFRETFYARQYKDIDRIQGHLEKILGMLRDFTFISIGNGVEGRPDLQQQKPGHSDPQKENPFRKASALVKEQRRGGDGRLEATPIGKRVAQLYIDPLTAHRFLQGMDRAAQGTNVFGLLQWIANTIEMRPLLSIKKGDFGQLIRVLGAEEANLIEQAPREWDMEYDDFLRSIKTAMLFEAWMQEMGEDTIMEKFGVAPGELHVRRESADWLLYALQELALLNGKMELLKEVRKLRLRIQYGLREELLPFVKLKGVGRVRSRLLWNAGIRGLADLRKVPLESLGRIVGYKIAEDIKQQLGEEESPETLQETLGPAERPGAGRE